MILLIVACLVAAWIIFLVGYLCGALMRMAGDE